MKSSIWRRAILLGVMFALGSTAFAAEKVDITLPTNIYFTVTNVAQSTSGGVTTISFTKDNFRSGNKLLISLQANSDLFTPSAGAAIPVGKVSWTGGTPGTLTNTAFRQVFLSDAGLPPASVDITWSLASLTGLAGLRAGSQTLTATWKLESVI